MHILITGGAGFIGSHLADALLERRDSVAIIDDLSTDSFENVQRLQGNPRFSFVIEHTAQQCGVGSARQSGRCDCAFGGSGRGRVGCETPDRDN